MTKHCIQIPKSDEPGCFGWYGDSPQSRKFGVQPLLVSLNNKEDAGFAMMSMLKRSSCAAHDYVEMQMTVPRHLCWDEEFTKDIPMYWLNETWRWSPSVTIIRSWAECPWMRSNQQWTAGGYLRGLTSSDLILIIKGTKKRKQRNKVTVDGFTHQQQTKAE